MTNKTTILNKKFQKSKFITGIRAYAALGVFLIHSAGFGLKAVSPVYSKLVDFGKYGVIAFFVLSAFTISMSIEREEVFSFKKYIIKRFFRVAPLYYIILLIAFFLGGNAFYAKEFGVENNSISLLYHFSFLNILDVKHQNNFIGVEWSVPIEFIYYLIIPFLLFYYRKKKNNILNGLLISALISIIGYIVYKYYFTPIVYHWSLIKYFFSFNFGIIIYLFFTSKKLEIEVKKYTVLILLLVLLVFIIFDFNYKDFFTTIFIGLLILVCKNKTHITFILFENNLIQFLGKISYSIYLIHMLFFQNLVDFFPVFQNGFVVLLFTLVISSVTYYTIEKPFIKIGKSLAKKI